jgi:hypothetical protein
MKFLSSSIVFIKNLNRSPITLLILFIGASYLFYVMYLGFTYQLGNPGGILQLSSYLIQGGMLCFLYYGYLATNDSVYLGKFNHQSLNLKNQSISYTSKITTILSINLIYCLISLMLISGIYYFRYHISEPTFYLDSTLFVFYYWFLTFGICTLFGFLIGLWIINPKLSFPIIIFLWLLFSPLNSYFLGSITKIFGFEIPKFLDISIDDPFKAFDPFSGLTVDNQDILLIPLILIILVVKVITSIRLKYDKSPYGKILSLICGIFIFLCLINITDLMIKQEGSNQHSFNPEAYQKEGYESNTLKTNTSVRKIKIKLEADSQYEIKVKIEFQDSIKSKRKSFFLYSGFDVIEVYGNKEKKIDFKQVGDEILLNNVEGHQTLTFKYRGNNVPYFFPSNDNIYLPYFSTWLPSQTSNLPFLYKGGSLLHQFANKEPKIQYELRYNGTNAIHTNLSKIGNNLYAGSSSKGISIISGDLISTNIRSSEVYYPSSWGQKTYGLQTYIKELEHYLNVLPSNSLNKVDNKDHKIFFIPISDWNTSLVSGDIWMNGKNIYIMVKPFDSFKPTSLNDLSALLPYQVAYGIVSSNQVQHQNESMKILFSLLMGTNINKQENEDSKMWKSIEVERIKSLDNNNETIQKLIDLDKSQKINDKFLSTWYRSLLSEQTISWDHLNKIIKEEIE